MIKQFELDLGKSLVTMDTKKFLPGDTIIQKHYMFHNEIIQKLGDIGTLKIYSNVKLNFNTIVIYNDNDSLVCDLNNNLSLYDNINLSLDLFFNKNNIKKDVSTTIVKEEPAIVEESVIISNKPKNEMTMEERILYARSLK